VSMRVYSPYRVLQASPTSPSRNAVLAALASEPQSKGVLHEWTRAWAGGQAPQASGPARWMATMMDKASQPGTSNAAQGAVLTEVSAADTPPKPHAPHASPPPAANTPRSDLVYHTVEGSAGGIASVLEAWLTRPRPTWLRLRLLPKSRANSPPTSPVRPVAGSGQGAVGYTSVHRRRKGTMFVRTQNLWQPSIACSQLASWP